MTVDWDGGMGPEASPSSSENTEGLSQVEQLQEPLKFRAAPPRIGENFLVCFPAAYHQAGLRFYVA